MMDVGLSNLVGSRDSVLLIAASGSTSHGRMIKAPSCVTGRDWTDNSGKFQMRGKAA